MIESNRVKFLVKLTLKYNVKETWLLYLIMFISYLVVGHFSSFISFQSQVVPVWLPAGIALAGCYLWWWRFFPAVFLASYVFNFSVHPDFSWQHLVSAIGMQNLLIATGATLQAAIGASLLRFWLGNPIRQISGRNSLYFIFIVGIAVNLISANVGVYALTVFNPLYDAENYQLNLVFWWLGDSLGVLLATPLILSILDYRKESESQQKVIQLFIGVIVLLFVIVISITRYFITHSNINNEHKVTHEVKMLENGVYRQISSTVNELKHLAEFIQNQPQLTKNEFLQFAQNVNHRSSSVIAMSWNPLISQADKSIHQQQLTADYQQTMVIRGQPITTDDPIVYVKYIYPEQENKKAIGFNIYSNAERKSSLITTMTSLQPTATPIIELVQFEQPVAGVLLFYPVFEKIDEQGLLATSRLIGFATAVVLPTKIITNAIDKSQENLFFYQIFEEGETTSFVDNFPENADEIRHLSEPPFSHTFEVAGQLWDIKLYPNKQMISKQQNQKFLYLLVILVLIVITITLPLLLMHSKQLILEQIVKKRTESLERAVIEANHANAAKSQFLANMSHEIRTPMNSVIGFAKLAKESNSLSDIKEYIEHIDVSSDVLMQIINDILDLAKIEANKLTVKHEVLDIHQVFERIHRIFKMEAQQKSLVWRIEDNIPKDLRFIGDRTHIEQVLMNLCGNALKFTEQGEVIVIADLLAYKGRTAHVQIQVKDTGIGISKEHSKRLFQPFTQADESTSRQFGGTGLGLTIAKKLSHLMAGDIKVESKLNQGTTFIFTLHLAIDSDSGNRQMIQKSFSQVQQRKNAASASAFALSHDDFSSLKVLVAEDNRINQKLIDKVLQRLGINAEIVENGALVIEHLQQSSFDVILMDCQMPVLDGYEATAKIRAMPEFADLPIIALTADVDTRSKERATSIGFNLHLSKPINIDELVAALQQILQQKNNQ
ncbi:ATP-binding protein [Thalassotalea sp. G2M2-11]|uniref:ATP-binding protein n=1 Tax=Thalassotalea sp. G2M2-11 TaxID=2787627 RepID=UPI0019D09837|nr:ATP-binding protein [Thalassotalea sp. G2M2-11]